MKKCIKCQKNKNENQFHIKSKKSGSLHSQCKQCQSEYQKQHYLNNKTTYKKRSKISNIKYKTNNKMFFDEYKLKKGCLFCDENEPCCLDFHHKDPKTKHRNISSMINSSLSRQTIVKEIHKCILVCANCHRKIHKGILII